MSEDMLGNVAPADVAGLMVTFWQRIAGRDGLMWLEAFKRFLRKENPWPNNEPVPAAPATTIWRTVEIGRHKGAETMATALKYTGNRISDWAEDILKRTPFAQGPETLKLVRASSFDLCGNRNASREEIFAAGLARGWRLCPAEVGPALREQCHDQLRGEWLLIAMEPIVGADGDLLLFLVDRGGDGRRWLRANDGHPGNRWRPGGVWVFLAPSEQ